MRLNLVRTRAPALLYQHQGGGCLPDLTSSSFTRCFGAGADPDIIFNDGADPDFLVMGPDPDVIFSDGARSRSFGDRWGSSRCFSDWGRAKCFGDGGGADLDVLVAGQIQMFW